jgi:pyruvate dehydrogenase E1 component
VADGILKGAYPFGEYGKGGKRATLLGSGAILTEVIQAAERLATEGYGVEVISVTSWSELAREGKYLRELLAKTSGPIVAASDYVRALPESVRFLVPQGRRYVTLGTDGFGRSDTRAALRTYFKVDSASIRDAALQRAPFQA